MSSQIFAKAWMLQKYSLQTKMSSPVFVLAALCLFAGSYLWRNYFNGLHDALFFQVLSLGALWYVYTFGVMRTLYEIRLNSSSFLIEDVKKISFWVGLLSCLVIYGCTVLFLEQFGFAGFIAFMVVFQPAIILGRRWSKWTDVVRLNTAGITPFLMVNIYFMLEKFAPLSALWLMVFVCIFIVFSIAIFYNNYKYWIHSPRNMSFLDADYVHVKKYYPADRGIDR